MVLLINYLLSKGLLLWLSLLLRLLLLFFIRLLWRALRALRRGSWQIRVQLLISEVQERAVAVWLVWCSPWIVPAEDLLMPLLLVEANLAFPRLENILLTPDYTILPCCVRA